MQTHTYKHTHSHTLTHTLTSSHRVDVQLRGLNGDACSRGFKHVLVHARKTGHVSGSTPHVKADDLEGACWHTFPPVCVCVCVCEYACYNMCVCVRMRVCVRVLWVHYVCECMCV